MISRGGQIGNEAKKNYFEDEWNFIMGASPHAPFRFGLAASARKHNIGEGIGLVLAIPILLYEMRWKA
jgi:hypothetical protein